MYKSPIKLTMDPYFEHFVLRTSYFIVILHQDMLFRGTEEREIERKTFYHASFLSLFLFMFACAYVPPFVHCCSFNVGSFTSQVTSNASHTILIQLNKQQTYFIVHRLHSPEGLLHFCCTLFGQ